MQYETLVPVVAENGSILQCLKERYLDVSNQIYTFAGDTLIAFKPFKDLDIYNQNVIDSYSNLPKGSLKVPHVFATAKEAYDLMMLAPDSTSSNQCVIVRGDCGSGKTEITKLLLKYWALANCRCDKLQKRLLQVYTVLEAFGNASTALNSNASRFGLCLTVYFTQGQGQQKKSY
jgi:myosin heavy subunit